MRFLFGIAMLVFALSLHDAHGAVPGSLSAAIALSEGFSYNNIDLMEGSTYAETINDGSFFSPGISAKLWWMTFLSIAAGGGVNYTLHADPSLDETVSGTASNGDDGRWSVLRWRADCVIASPAAIKLIGGLTNCRKNPRSLLHLSNNAFDGTGSIPGRSMQGPPVHSLP